jgi:integrase
MDLRIGDVQLKDNRIFIRGEISKNKMDDYVSIPDTLRKNIKKSGILNYKATDLIFSKDGLPGTERLHNNFFWDKHRRILVSTGLLELNSNYSLYSYKHTGAISLYKATKDVKIVQQQCRHQSVGQTDAYLRDLGLHSNYHVLKGWKGAA